jgi:DNA modification methylase
MARRTKAGNGSAEGVSDGAVGGQVGGVEAMAIASLVPYGRNARTHTPGQVAQIAASIREFGWTAPVLIDVERRIVAGHGRVLAAQSMGADVVPCVTLPGEWSEAKRRAYIIADNKLALNADWDFALLSAELQELDTGEFPLTVTGFSETELAQIATWTPDGGTGPRDEQPEDPPIPLIPTDPQSRPGDVWLCDGHRVMCGDCRDAVQVDALLAGTSINLAFTSPPYAEQRKYDETSAFRPIPPDEYVEWFAPIAANVRQHLAADGSWFINIKPPGAGLDTHLYVFDLVIAHARRWGWHFATEFCWERGGVPKIVTRRFKNQFEPVYQFALGEWKMRPDDVRHFSENVPIPFGPGAGNTNWANNQGGNGAMFGARKRKGGTREAMSDVQGQPGKSVPGEYIAAGMAYPGNRLPSFSGSHEATGHTAAFPVGLPEWFVRAYTDEGDAVYDPFMGSGSTLLAADRRARRGYGMEISPAYVDVIVTRWMRSTGKVAIREQDGAEFIAPE